MANSAAQIQNSPSLKDVARQVGLSAMTVSNVLRAHAQGQESSSFSEDTRRRVIKVAQEMGYVPNRAARAMRTAHTGIIGFVAANFSKEIQKVENYLIHPFLVGLNHVLSPTGRHVTLIELNELELQSGRLPQSLRERFFDALVIHYGLTPSTLSMIEQLKVPAVYWDSGVFKGKGCLYRDELSVGKAVTGQLIALGHTRIAFFLGSGSNWDRYQRGEYVHYSFIQNYEGYRATMEAHGLPPVFLRGYDSQILARQIEAKQLTACVTSSHYLTHLQALQSLGKTIPHDFSILACAVEDSIVTHEAPGGALYNRYEAGRSVGHMVLQALVPGGQAPTSIILPATIDLKWTACPPPIARVGTP